MYDIIIQILFVVVAYLLGSVSSAILVSQIFNLPDPRSLGSGNPGATNVLRTGNKIAAGITLLGDVLKGLLPVLVADLFIADIVFTSIVGLAALLGHMYPIYYKFKGGKGVATLLGVLLGIDWIFGLIWAAIWLVVALIFRYSSLSALVATLLMLIYSWFSFENELLFIVLLSMTILVYWRHRINIRNLISGKEAKIGS